MNHTRTLDTLVTTPDSEIGYSLCLFAVPFPYLVAFVAQKIANRYVDGDCKFAEKLYHLPEETRRWWEKLVYLYAPLICSLLYYHFVFFGLPWLPALLKTQCPDMDDGHCIQESFPYYLVHAFASDRRVSPLVVLPLMLLAIPCICMYGYDRHAQRLKCKERRKQKLAEPSLIVDYSQKLDYPSYPVSEIQDSIAQRFIREAEMAMEEATGEGKRERSRVNQIPFHLNDAAYHMLLRDLRDLLREEKMREGEDLEKGLLDQCFLTSSQPIRGTIPRDVVPITYQIDTRASRRATFGEGSQV